jgi:hypothetical protein
MKVQDMKVQDWRIGREMVCIGVNLRFGKGLMNLF